MNLRKVRLEEICQIQNGFAFDSTKFSEKEGMPLIRIRDLRLSECSLRFTGEYDTSYVVRRGDILVGMDGEFDAFEWQGENALLNQRVCRLIPRFGELDAIFLVHYIKCYLKRIEDQTPSTTVKHLSSKQLSELEWLIPSYADQRRIAAQLKAQLAAVEETRQATQAQIKDVELLAQRIREETLPELADAKRIVLGDLLTGIEAGKSFQTSDRMAKHDELGVLKVSAVSWAKFQANEAKAIDGNYSPDQRHRVKAGDLLISRANTVELVGAVVRVDRDYPNRLLSDKTLRLLVDEERVCPGYLLQALRLPEARTHIESNATGTSNSMRNIGQDTIRAIPIPLPPLAIQQRIVERLHNAEIALNQLKQAVDASLKDIDLLPSRLLAEAFGEG
jgi:type I restriction enzyme S subunit